MVYKQSTLNNSERKYIVDTVGPYPVTLLELDANNFTIAKAYIHANGQVLMQYNGDPNSADKYFYLHDRLGSIRALIDENGYVANCYLFSPSGLTFLLNGDTAETVENPFWFAGYNFDKVTYMYYCNARWYDPDLYRFTGRDPILGSFREPMTLHAYLYCLNDPVNYIDPTGEIALNILSGALEGVATYTIGANLMMASIDYQGQNKALSEFLWTAGDFAVWITPLAIVHGLANPIQLGRMRTVTHWPGKAGYQGWVQLGGKNCLSYSFSGMIGRGLPGSAYYRSGAEFLVEASRLKWPAGWQFFKGFIGQRILMP